MASSQSLNGVNRSYILAAAAVGVGFLGAGMYLRRRQQQDGATLRGKPEESGSGFAQPEEVISAAAAPEHAGAPTVGESARSPAAEAPGTAAAVVPGSSDAASGTETVVWRGVSTLHANGSVRRGTDARWCWSEDETDVIVETAACDVKSPREVSVKFEPRHLALSVRGESIIDGDLVRPVHPEECSWQFEGSGKDRRVVLTLAKALASAVPWNMVIQNTL